MEKNQAHKVKSADRVLDIFELFTGGTDSYNLSEIAKKLNMPPSSTYLILQNMLSRGYLETDKSGKQFRIGYKLFTIRNRYIQNTSLTGEFYQIADKITEDLNETVSLSVRSGNQLLYIGEKISSQALRFTPNQSDVFPLHATASGKILLADFSDEELLALYPDEKLEQVTNKTITSLKQLQLELNKVRQQGYGYNRGETVLGVHCVAGAVVDAKNQTVASISISVPEVRMTEEIWDKVHVWIKRACDELGRKVYR